MSPINEDNVRANEFVVPKGFKAASLKAGIKPSGKPDLALFTSEAPSRAAGMFTKNLYPAAPVLVCREHLNVSQFIRAIICNAGNANACTGDEGLIRTRRMVKAGADALECAPNEVLPASTGVIGHQLPVEKIEAAAQNLKNALSDKPSAFAAAAEAIMTTDTFPKWASAEVIIDNQSVRLLGITKGSGMIHPDLATTLTFLFTDAEIEPEALKSALNEAIDVSFHCLTVDGDTSTNDCALLLANGLAGNKPLTLDHPEWGAFQWAVAEVCKSLARQIAADGEGAEHFIQITVSGAASFSDARQVAKTVALSSLTKTAVAGNDPNWGRIVAAAGRSGVNFNPDALRLTLGDIPLFANGAPLDYDAAAASNYMREGPRVDILIDLGNGEGEAIVWTCDLTKGYVQINSEYTT